MKTMKQIYVALTLALAVVASGCSDDLSDTVRTLPDKPAEKMTIHATTGQQSGTRVAYEDGAAGMNGKLTWQKGDRLTVVRMNGSDYVAYADEPLPVLSREQQLPMPVTAGRFTTPIP